MTPARKPANQPAFLVGVYAGAKPEADFSGYCVGSGAFRTTISMDVENNALPAVLDILALKMAY